MTYARLLPLLAATLLPVPALATGASLAEIYDDFGITLTWTAEENSATGTRLVDAVLTAPEMTIRSRNLSWSPGSGAVWMENGEITATNGSASPVLFTGAAASHPLSLVAISGLGLCSPVLRAQGSLEMIYSGLSIRAMPSSLPWEHPMERLDAGEAAVVYSLADDGQCLEMNSLTATDISGRGQDRSRITIDAMEISATVSEPLTFDATFSARNLSAFDPLGAPLGSAGQFDLEVSADIPEPASRLESDLVDAVIAGRSHFSLAARDVYLPVADLAGDLAPEPDLVAGSMISGYANLAITHENETIGLTVDTDLRGFGLAHGTIDIQLLASDAVMGFGAFFGENRPGLATAERLAIAGMQMRLRDQGALALAGALRGMTFEEAKASLVGKLSRLPSALHAPVLAFIDRALDTGASVSASPEVPVGLSEVGMAALLQPSRIESMLVLETD